MQITLNEEEKTIGRHLCLLFRNFFGSAQLEGAFEEYNIYVNDILYWVFGDIEIYPIIQNGMKVNIVHKREDPQQALINGYNFQPEPGSVSRPEKNQVKPNLLPFSSKTQLIQPDKAPKLQQDYNQTMPIQLQQIEKKINKQKEVLFRFPFFLKCDLVIGIQIINNDEKTIEIFYRSEHFEDTISESDEKISLYQFQKENHPKDQLMEYFNYKNVTVYWADTQKQLLVQWPDYTLSYKFFKNENLY